jgi:hypothetical protein
MKDFNSLMTKADDFFVHLSRIYELEMFYGDDTLEDLIRHSKQLMNDFYSYEDQYYQEQLEEEDFNDANEKSEEKES